MTGVLLDTHAWVWTLTDDPRLSIAGREAITAAETVRVSPISFFEIGQKVRVGKWPEMAPHVDSLPDQLRGQGGMIAPFSADVALLASLLDWPHRDPFDRIIGATAALSGDTLISADAVFSAWPDDRLRRVW
ncbi:type II toxin-antitoxin system VapC family toxin [Meridianimarinicoccus aquatilis]|uniref:Type II toxin-antitoxin system VapC family toxin n=1 Tax=Meridianimarinicoccus aquatilis TaxID=2552766 RepID=A0A4R6AQ83_9RHOB|nr:type II toxin-antitoxin system VapC family toxin [Fluviibacterium aquatile]QIE43821.1 type II toxin-antitoxin system VapC family toxin [Rhodobacteraceae bacterium SC52]TDL85642.1 type II toxin-antitoxin system VapC family toxin [Fluviibacterium aquatile]